MTFPKIRSKLGQSKKFSIFAMFFSHMTCPYLVNDHGKKAKFDINAHNF